MLHLLTSVSLVVEGVDGNDLGLDEGLPLGLPEGQLDSDSLEAGRILPVE